MSLLLSEDFALYNLRLGYLQNINDGVGERLIILNSAILSDPAYKAAGFTPDNAAIKRCYSPPIPTTGAAQYFTRPARSAQGFNLQDGDDPDEDGGGLITGRTSEDTLGPAAINEKEKRRRRQRERLEEDDSSDLSDDSDEEVTMARGVRFAKSKGRTDSSLSPPRLHERTSQNTNPEVHIISPSFRPRTSSLSTPEAARVTRRRPRGDTITSSEFSSESEMLDVNAVFKGKLPSRPQKTAMLASKIAEEDAEDESELDEEDEEDVEVAEASDLSDDFEGDDIAGPGGSFLEAAVGVTSSPLQSDAIIPEETQSRATVISEPPGTLPEELPGLPAGQALTTKPAGSLLSMALRGDVDNAETTNAFQKYAELSGKGEANPLWIKIYYPFTDGKPLEVPIRRQTTESGPPKVADLIGLALYRYEEEGRQPKLEGTDLKLARWELRMMDDGEVEMDFPALNATRSITDFTSNNSRPPQRRARDKPWDEFGLIRAKGFKDVSDPAPIATRKQSGTVPSRPAPPVLQPSMTTKPNPITGPSFTMTKTNTIRKESSNLLDAPTASAATSTPRTGLNKTIMVHFTDPHSFNPQTIEIETTTDTYIAEIFNTACNQLRLDKALYVLRVRGTQTVAPSDRTVEALGGNLHLDLGRRRFGAVGDFGLGTSGSPGSTSPNAPLQLVPNTPPVGSKGDRTRRGRQAGLAGLQTGKSTQTLTAAALNLATMQDGRRYNVQRKQPLSFSASHPRTLVITPEFLQVLPAQSADDGGPVVGKVTNIHMSSIVGVKVSRKHPKMVRVVVYKEKEAKRYDFECANREEAQAIVADVRVGVGEYGNGLHEAYT